jgi:hypothetical protein
MFDIPIRSGRVVDGRRGPARPGSILRFGGDPLTVENRTWISTLKR